MPKVITMTIVGAAGYNIPVLFNIGQRGRGVATRQAVLWQLS
jgi:hypothetical protein